MSSDKEKVLKYLEDAHRPYNLNDIHQNLLKDRTKAVLQKALDELVSEQKIREKIYNKQKIYSLMPKSDQKSDDILTEVQETELLLLQKTEGLKKLEEEYKSFENQLLKLQCIPTMDEADTQKNELEKSVKCLQTKLSSLSQGEVMISKTDKEKVSRDYDSVMKIYKKRKRICTDILDSILENYPKKKSALMEEIGIELDDDKTRSILKT